MEETLSLEKVLIFWEDAEGKAQDKLEMLEKYIFQHLGLKHDVDYYERKGKMLERFVAGFVHGYFDTISDLAFILLDPMHIFDVLTALVKNLLSHPLQMIKYIWDTWTYYWSHGAFGIGWMMSEIFITCLLSILCGFAVGKQVVSVLKSSAAVFSESLLGNITYVPEKLLGIGSFAKTAQGFSVSILKSVINSPGKLISDTIKSLDIGTAYGKLREYKLYTEEYIKD